MDKKLEQRIARLEKVLSRKNEQTDSYVSKVLVNTVNQIDELCKSLEKALKATRVSYEELDEMLSLYEEKFPTAWFDKFIRTIHDKIYR